MRNFLCDAAVVMAMVITTANDEICRSYFENVQFVHEYNLASFFNESETRMAVLTFPQIMELLVIWQCKYVAV